jgi:hypothetical protein
VAELVGMGGYYGLDDEGNPVPRGLLYRDERGIERFAYPGSPQLLAAFGLPSTPLTAPVQGLNIGFETFPGFGPVATVAVSAILPDSASLDGVEEFLFPYGRPEGSWVQQGARLSLPGWFHKVLNVNGSLDKRAWGSTVMDAVRYRTNTGEYAVQGPGASADDVRALTDQAIEDGSWLVMLRGFGQGILPASPGYDWYLEDGQGRRISAIALQEDLQRLRDEDPDMATLRFLERHGDAAFALLQGKTVSVSPGGGLPPTADAEKWLDTHRGVRDSYPAAYGFFAPQGGDIDMNAYERTLELKDRVPIDPKVMVNASNAIVAKALYYQTRDAVLAANAQGGRNSLTAEQSVAMWALRQELARRYPGYNPDGGELILSVAGAQPLPAKTDPGVVIDQLTQAVDDPALADSGIVEPLRWYLQARTQVEAASTEAWGKDDAWLTRSDAAPARATLYAMGSRLAAEYPEFTSVWEMALLREIDAQIAADELRTVAGG